MHRCANLLALFLLTPLARPATAADAWTRVGPDTGNVRALAAAPSSPATVYAGASVGGIFRSLDGGATWSLASGGLKLQDTIRSLAVDIRRPDTVWAGTFQGIYRSLNGGASWIRVNGSSAASLVQDPASGTLYAGVQSAPMLRSRDGGASWQTLAGSPQNVFSLAIDPFHPRTLYGGTLSGVFKSTDGGAKWFRLTRGLPASPVVTALVLVPRSPKTLYVATASVIPGQIIFRSDDGGGRWTPVDGGMLPGYTYALAVQPGKQETVWAVSAGRLFRSSDRGQTWIPAGAGLPPDDTVVTVLPGASTLLAGTASGAFRSDDQGASWSLSSRGMQAASITGLALDTLRPNRLWASTAGSGVFRTASGGGHWALLTGVPPGVNGPLAADPNHPGTAYLGLLGAIARTEDAGNHWSPGSPLSCFYPEMIAVDPLESSVVYTAGTFFDAGCGDLPGACASFRSDDSGQHWTCIRGGNFLVPDPLQSSRVYALAGDNLYVSADRGASWSLLAAGVNLRFLVADPQRPGTLWGVNPSGPFRSDDGGRTWALAADGIPQFSILTTLTLDPVDPDILYADTLQRGVFKSSDGGVTWAPLGTGLEGLNVFFLAIDPRDRNTVYAGTSEAGVLKLRQALSLH